MQQHVVFLITAEATAEKIARLTAELEREKQRADKAEAQVAELKAEKPKPARAGK